VVASSTRRRASLGSRDGDQRHLELLVLLDHLLLSEALVQEEPFHELLFGFLEVLSSACVQDVAQVEDSISIIVFRILRASPLLLEVHHVAENAQEGIAAGNLPVNWEPNSAEEEQLLEVLMKKLVTLDGIVSLLCEDS